MNRILYILVILISSYTTCVGEEYYVDSNLISNENTINSDVFSNQQKTLHFQTTISQFNLLGEEIIEYDEIYYNTPLIIELPSLEFCFINQISSEIYLFDVILFQADSSPPTIS